jgi:hypothetical protein
LSDTVDRDDFAPTADRTTVVVAAAAAAAEPESEPEVEPEPKPEPDEATVVASSAAWLKSFGLRAARITVRQMVAQGESDFAKHAAAADRRFTSELRSRSAGDLAGLVTQVRDDRSRTHDLYLLDSVMDAWQADLARITKNVKRRLAWLRSGSRKFFGTCCERNVVIVIDMSRHAASFEHTLRKALLEWLSDQLYLCFRINFIVYGGEWVAWRSAAIEAQPQDLDEAVDWLDSLVCTGRAYALPALRAALQDARADAFYWVASGPILGTSTQLLVQEVADLCDGRPVHCVSFNCVDTATRDCLRTVAAATHGRYHAFWLGAQPREIRKHEGVEGDDLDLLKRELAHAREVANRLYRWRLHRADALSEAAAALERAAAAERETHSRLHDIVERSRSSRASSASRLRSATRDRASSVSSSPPSSSSSSSSDSSSSPSDDEHHVSDEESQRHRRQRRRSTFAIKETVQAVMGSQKWVSKHGVSASEKRVASTLTLIACDAVIGKMMKRSASALSKGAALAKLADAAGVSVPKQSTDTELAGEAVLREHVRAVRHCMDLLEQRIAWLQSGSRQTFGVLPNVPLTLVVDFSEHVHIVDQDLYVASICNLVREQVEAGGNRHFNVLRCGGKVAAWQEHVVAASPEKAKQARAFLRSQRLAGACDVETAVRRAASDASKSLMGGEV